MIPTFQIIANNTDITNKIRDRILSLILIDESGLESDSVSIVIDDRDNRINLPPKGAEIQISLGYKQKGMIEKGLYTVDEIICSGSPDTVTIRCRAADMRASLKEKKTRSMENITIGDLIGTIASEHVLKPAVSNEFLTVQIQHIDQRNESDLHMLTRLAKQYDAIAKPMNGYLLFATRGEAKSVSGHQLTSVQLHRNQITDYQVTFADRGKYQSVIAHWHDQSTGERMPVRIGEEKPVNVLRHTYPDATSAAQAASAKLSALQRGVATGSINVNPAPLSLMAEGKLILSGFREGISGEWIISRVEYQFDRSGLSAQCEFETLK